MSRKYKLGQENCPRCNAEANLKPVEKSGIVLIYIVCPKCRFKEYKGMTTWDTISTELLIKKLKTILATELDPLTAASIRSRILKLRLLQRQKELGL